MSSTEAEIQDIKRMLLGILDTITELTFGLAGSGGNTSSADIVLGLGVIVFLASLIATIYVYLIT